MYTRSRLGASALLHKPVRNKRGLPVCIDTGRAKGALKVQISKSGRDITLGIAPTMQRVEGK
jgi:hypothetical protein